VELKGMMASGKKGVAFLAPRNRTAFPLRAA